MLYTRLSKYVIVDEIGVLYTRLSKYVIVDEIGVLYTRLSKYVIVDEMVYYIPDSVNMLLWMRWCAIYQTQ